ncbi:MAG: hypothetical protein QOI89_3639 [Solirubrobacteraceae bacterium]|nr:hypothetical protein [Solirubrobacteraceae bacterium]
MTGAGAALVGGGVGHAMCAWRVRGCRWSPSCVNASDPSSIILVVPPANATDPLSELVVVREVVRAGRVTWITHRGGGLALALLLDRGDRLLGVGKAFDREEVNRGIGQRARNADSNERHQDHQRNERCRSSDPLRGRLVREIRKQSSGGCSRDGMNGDGRGMNSKSCGGMKTKLVCRVVTASKLAMRHSANLPHRGLAARAGHGRRLL